MVNDQGILTRLVKELNIGSRKETDEDNSNKRGWEDVEEEREEDGKEEEKEEGGE